MCVWGGGYFYFVKPQFWACLLQHRACISLTKTVSYIRQTQKNVSLLQYMLRWLGSRRGHFQLRNAGETNIFCAPPILCFHSHTSTQHKNTMSALVYQMSCQKLGAYLFNRCSPSLYSDKVPKIRLGGGDGAIIPGPCLCGQGAEAVCVTWPNFTHKILS